MDKRALEILGDLISSVTGVPSARDHRKLLEQLNLLKLDKDELEIVLRKSTETNKAILSSLHFHDEKIAANTNQLAVAMNRLNLQAGKATRMLEILNFKAKVDLMMVQVDQQISKAINILQDGRDGRVSENSISKANLISIIESIILKQRILRPVFEGKDVYKYFKLDTSHTWADLESKTIFSLLQIPLADMSESNSITILKPNNVLHTDLGLAVVNYKASYYRYLSNTDFLRCINHEKIKMCQKRNIEIDLDRACNVRVCSKWANIVAHDLTNSEILMILPPNQTATLTCKDRDPVTVRLPAAGICKLSTSCSLISDLFMIDSFAFNRHIRDEVADIQFEVLAQNDASVFKPVTQDQITDLNETAKGTIELAMRLNNETILELEKYQNNSRHRWNNLEKEVTPVLQIVLWSLVIASIVGIVILTIQLIIVCFRLAKINATLTAQRPDTNDQSYHTDIMVLAGKVAALESELLQLRMSSNTCTELEPATTNDALDEDVD